MRQFLWNAWCSLSGAEKASVIGALVAASLGILLGICTGLFLSIPKVIAWRCKSVLLDLDDAEEKLRISAKAKASGDVSITDTEIVKESGHSQWMVRRAERWQRLHGSSSDSSPSDKLFSPRLKGR